MGIYLNRQSYTLFVESISDLIMLFGKFGVDVLFGLLILLLLFDFVELVLDLLVAIFQETLLEGLNSFFKSLKL